MGYYTAYTLRIEDDPDHEKLKAVLEEEGEDSDIYFAVDDNGESNSAESKWYDWETDMRRISTNWPNFVFHLSGIGDQHDDQWEATFKNGKAHIRQCEILIAEYDENCLE